MDNHGQSPDALSALVDNPFLKGFLVVATLYGFIAKYIKSANKRRRETATLSKRYKLGWIFLSIQRVPFIVHSVVAYTALLGAVGELAILLDQFALHRDLAKLPPKLQSSVEYFSSHFVLYFLVALLLFVLFDNRAVEHTLAWLFGLFPRMRRTIDWANAKWQLNAEPERRILAPSSPELDQVAARVVDELAQTARGNSLALRPEGLPDETAANILYLGHAIEEHCAQIMKRSFPWTLFYAALGKLGLEKGSPLSVESVKRFAGETGFFSVLLRANAHLAQENQIPNDPGLEQSVKEAFEKLRSNFSSDARNIATGIAITDYSCVLRRSHKFLKSDGMRRQFAKLFILWKLKENATHPEMFRIPFNTNIFTRYLDDGVIRVEGDRFDSKSELVGICFEAIQTQLVQRVSALLAGTQDAKRVEWRNAEKHDIETRGIDWTWWVYYRADVQTYHDCRTYSSPNWRRQGDEISRRRPPPAATQNEDSNEDEAPVEN